VQQHNAQNNTHISTTSCRTFTHAACVLRLSTDTAPGLTVFGVCQHYRVSAGGDARIRTFSGKNGATKTAFLDFDVREILPASEIISINFGMSIIPECNKNFLLILVIFWNMVGGGSFN